MTEIFIVDPSDFCRPCRGKGFTSSYDRSPWPPYHMGTVTEKCSLCGGSGNRSVRVSEAPAHKASAA